VNPSPGLSDLGRFIRQRRELGEDSWVLEELPRGAVLELAAHVTAPAPARDEWPGVGFRPAEPTHPVPDEAGAGDCARSSYDELRQEAIGCTRCRLASGRGQVVFSDGNPAGRVMVVGEAPGANEDRTGLPFVGAAGKLLDLLLATVDLSRKKSVYICNVIKCRPPGNRNPRQDEIAACSPFLHRQIALVRPEVILAVGTFAAQLLSGQERPLGKLRGEVYAYDGTPLIVTYHPAALLRNPGWTRSTWDDLQLLRHILTDQ
jgi:uracil-DNA glycosylase family 4